VVHGKFGRVNGSESCGVHLDLFQSRDDSLEVSDEITMLEQLDLG
jgi:hypothetical protein